MRSSTMPEEVGSSASTSSSTPRRVATTALAEVVGGSRGHRDDFALWGYLGFLDDTCLHWVHAGCPTTSAAASSMRRWAA